MEEKHFYHIVSGQVVFLATQEDDTKEIRNAMLNVLAPLENSQISLAQLGAMQQQLQRALFQKLGSNEGIEILDVVIISISPLGHMTKKEFGIESDKAAND